MEKRLGIKEYSPKEYWDGVAEKFRSSDGSGLAPVLHPDAPAWFNQLIDNLQFRAMRRALEIAELETSSRVLDVGCGTGRWIRRYEEMGFRVSGLDATLGMLHTARERGTMAPLIVGEAHGLPFEDESFDAVSDVTVVQHIPVTLQSQTLGEMLRVLKPGGRLILMELIRGQGAHIFPHTPEEWIQQVKSLGGTLLGWFGEEFLPIDRMFTTVAQTVGGQSRNHDLNIPPTDVTRQNSQVRGAYWKIRRATATVAAWTEPASEKIFPARLATHGAFVFRK